MVEPSVDRHQSVHLAISRMLLAAGLFAAASLAGFAWWARFPVPYRDDWDWLLWMFQGPWTLTRLFQPHNEHMIPLPRLLMALQYGLQGARGTLLCWVAIASQAIVAGVVVREIRSRWADAPEHRNAVVGASLVLVCFGYQLQSLVFVAAVLFPLVQALAAIAIVCSATPGPPGDGRPAATGPWRLAASVCASLAAMATTSNGLIVPFVLAVTAYQFRRHWTVFALHVAIAVAGTATFARIVLGSSAASAFGAMPLAEHGASTLGYFFAFFVPFVTYGSQAIGALAGAAGVLLGALLCLRALVHRDTVYRADHVAVALMLFAMGSGAMAALGRAQFGLDQAAQSRYATFALVYWTALYVAGASWWHARNGRLFPDAAPARAMALAGVGVVLVAHVFTGVVWVAKTGNIRAAGLALAADVPDEEWIVTLHPLTGVIHAAVAATRADGDRSLVSPLLGTRVALDTTVRPCQAALMLTRAPGSTSLRLSGRLEEGASRGLILDATGIVIGLAEPAPLVVTPNASRAAVTGAVAAALRTGTWTGTPGWLGFASASPAAPIALVATDRRDRILCRTDLPLM